MSVEYDPDNQFVNVVFSQDFTIEMAAGLFSHARKLANEFECNSFLLNFKNSRVPNSTSIPFDHIENPHEFGLERTQKYAIVYSNSNEHSRFFEIIFQNRGYQVESFSNEGTAIDGLKSP